MLIKSLEISILRMRKSSICTLNVKPNDEIQLLNNFVFKFRMFKLTNCL
jgi:hypothetical protein